MSTLQYIFVVIEDIYYKNKDSYNHANCLFLFPDVFTYCLSNGSYHCHQSLQAFVYHRLKYWNSIFGSAEFPYYSRVSLIHHSGLHDCHKTKTRSQKKITYCICFHGEPCVTWVSFTFHFYISILFDNTVERFS